MPLRIELSERDKVEKLDTLPGGDGMKKNYIWKLSDFTLNQVDI